MAEVVGVVAAGFAFAEAVVKLHTIKRLWDDVNDVPDNIKSLVEKVTLIGLLIEEMEADLISPNLACATAGNNIHTFLVASCRRSLDVLTLSVSELSQEIKSKKRIKRAVVKGKIVLKKDFWARYEQRLQQLALHLELTQQQLTIWLIKRQPEIIVSRLAQSIKEAEPSRTRDVVCTTTCSSQNKDSHKFTGKITYRTRTSLLFGSIIIHSTQNGGATRHDVEFNPPNWLTQKGWSIITSRSYSGFNINLRTYNVVEHDAPVMRLAYLGDIPGLLDLFDRKLASPFDISKGGDRLIDCAIVSADAQVVATMADWGLDLDQCFDPTKHILGICYMLMHRNTERIEEVHQLALSRNVYENIADSWDFCGKGMSKSAKLLVTTCAAASYDVGTILPYLWPGYYDLPVEERLNFARMAFNSKAFRYFLWPGGRVRPDDIHTLEQRGTTLLFAIAMQYSTNTCTTCNSSSAWDEDWRRLARDVIPLTPWLDAIRQPLTDGASFTPSAELFAVIAGFEMDCTYARKFYRDMRGLFTDYECQIDCKCAALGFPLSERRRIEEKELALQRWLEDLHICGIDLNVYGMIAKEMFFDHFEHGGIPQERLRIYTRGSRDFLLTLADVSYGPMPQDWKFVWTFDYGEMVAEFWDLIEDPPVNMIGAWVDDDSEDYVEDSDSSDSEDDSMMTGFQVPFWLDERKAMD